MQVTNIQIMKLEALIISAAVNYFSIKCCIKIHISYLIKAMALNNLIK